MKVSDLNELRATTVERRFAQTFKSLFWLGVAIFLSYLAWKPETVPFELSFGSFTTSQLIFLVSLAPWLAFSVYAIKAFGSYAALSECRTAETELSRATSLQSISDIDRRISDYRRLSIRNPLVKKVLESKEPGLENRKREIRKDEAYAVLNTQANKALNDIDPFLNATKNELALCKAKARITASLKLLKNRREELEQQWEAAYDQFSWWNKLKFSGGPDFSELDRMLRDLAYMERRLNQKHGDDLIAIERHFERLKGLAVNRILDARREADNFIKASDGEDIVGAGVLRKAMWLSMLSVPISLWTDVDRAANVFSAIRGVNSNFAGMSDAEIWWETLFMPSESLAGLAGLAKGAYFEQIVASDTGGQLHEHFNNPDTDIVIDGTAYQIKATDSESYVNSVADGVPVITTSEIAMTTDSINSGYSDEELTNAVDLALGGTVVDIGDTAVDAILSGVGGLGFFATIQGLNHAVAKHENGGDGVEAMFEGAGVAIEGTARGLVGAAEMGYKVLSSKPSRFVGRLAMKSLVKLDEKMMAPPDRT